MRDKNPTNTCQIRPANEKDLDQICALGKQINDQHLQHVPGIFTPNIDASEVRAFWKNALEIDNGTIFVACIGEQIVGFISVSWIEHLTNPYLQRKKICRVGTIVVAENCFQRGIGKALMEAASDWGHAQRATEIRLEVFDFNRNAIGFYQKLGFDVQTHFMGKPL
ncbi:MAG: GNAT family N-acetyltransferase [Burkholderiales bacterium]|nr:GNAT family N-acetyltransferase [Burkholderiales bacterium]